MRYVRSLLGFLGRTLETCLRAWQRFYHWLQLWFRARFHIGDRVSHDLIDIAEQAERFIGKSKWLDRDVLTWDYEVRSILRKHLGPDHLQRYELKTTLDASREDDIIASAEALKRAQHEIQVSAWALHSKTIVPRGGVSDAWWFRAAVPALTGASAAALIGLIITFSGVTAGDGPSKMETVNTTSGTTQNIVEDPGKVVQISPVPAPTPAETPLPVSEEPVIDIPANPEEDQPIETSEIQFAKGVAALQVGNFELAVEKFEAAIETEPGFVRAYYNLAVAYDNIGTEEANQAAVKNYTAAIELWNSLESNGDGLLFEAKLGRGLLLVSFFTDEQAICLGRSDLREYLERGDVSQRNTEAVNKALAGIEVDCEKLIEIS